MKRSSMRPLVLLLVFLLSGCAHMPAILKQLKDDPATVDMTIVSPIYGSVIFHRAYPTNWIGTIRGP